MQHSCSHYNAFWHRFAAARAHSCSHYNPICIHALQNTKEEPIRPRNDRSRNRRTQDLPFIAGCSHPTRKNTRFRALDSSPTQVPCNIHSSITMRFVMLYDVLLCDVLLCDVLLCDVLFSDELWCIVMWCIVLWCLVTWCIVMWCIVVMSCYVVY